MKVAWLFPGQGSQEVGMGRSVASAFAGARDVFRRADAALTSAGSDGPSITNLCFEGPLEVLTLTENTQPSLVTTELAIVAALAEAHPELSTPTVALGHSLGEYSALVAAGALTLEQAVGLCRVRGRAMQAAAPPGSGAMAAVIGAAPEVVEAACAEAASSGQHVSAANFNAPGQIVIAGGAQAVAVASEILLAQGAKVIPLKVSAPFHCELMRPAARELALALEPLTVGRMAYPVIANVNAQANQDSSAVKSLLVDQVCAPVQWVRSIEKAVAMGVEVALEIGPGKVLSGLAKRIDKKLRVINIHDEESIRALSL